MFRSECSRLRVQTSKCDAEARVASLPEPLPGFPCQTVQEGASSWLPGPEPFSVSLSQSTFRLCWCTSVDPGLGSGGRRDGACREAADLSGAPARTQTPGVVRAKHPSPPQVSRAERGQTDAEPAPCTPRPPCKTGGQDRSHYQLKRLITRRKQRRASFIHSFKGVISLPNHITKQFFEPGLVAKACDPSTQGYRGRQVPVSSRPA